MNKLNKLKQYVFEIYRDKGGIGEERLFNSKEAAVEYASREWAKLTAPEKKMTNICHVYEVEISPEDLIAYNEGDLELSLADLWSADIWSAK